MQDLKIAVITTNSRVGRTAENLENMTGWTIAAKKQGAEIVCFPELNITGYSNHKDIVDAAEPISGKSVRYISSLALSEKITILAGIAEKSKTGKIYASHITALPGASVKVYRKTHIAPPERNCYMPGNAIEIFETDKVKFGIQLCYDAHFPELSTYMTSKGVELIFIPHASPGTDAAKKHDSWMRHLRARAYDNSIFIAACNQIGDNLKGLRFPGNAVILDPLGNIIKKKLSQYEGMLTATLKAEDLKRVKTHHISYFFPNRRTRLYKE